MAQTPFLCFNTQPPEGGWPKKIRAKTDRYVSTHSRLKAAGPSTFKTLGDAQVSTHSRLKAAGPTVAGKPTVQACFNTQPPEGGWPHNLPFRAIWLVVSTHSRPKAAAHFLPFIAQPPMFQHTAARRRLWDRDTPPPLDKGVSTHSRPKAAG